MMSFSSITSHTLLEVALTNKLGVALVSQDPHDRKIRYGNWLSPRLKKRQTKNTQGRSVQLENKV